MKMLLEVRKFFLTFGRISENSARPQALLFKKSIGLGYIHNHDGIVDKEYVMNAEYKINILNEGFKATPSLSPLYDPKMEKVKA